MGQYWSGADAVKRGVVDPEQLPSIGDQIIVQKLDEDQEIGIVRSVQIPDSSENDARDIRVMYRVLGASSSGGLSWCGLPEIVEVISKDMLSPEMVRELMRRGAEKQMRAAQMAVIEQKRRAAEQKQMDDFQVAVILKRIAEQLQKPQPQYQGEWLIIEDMPFYSISTSAKELLRAKGLHVVINHSWGGGITARVRFLEQQEEEKENGQEEPAP